ncbi:MAG TPA: Sec-independent protein translocase protein TatB [Thermoanaerobaculia bacterium]|nr:Sec-independent protein translocase protein TatB [Thermoanaerobaculia bacterium]
MGSIGFMELLLIFVVALLVFGPRKLPEIGRTLGRAIGEFRKATHDFRSSLEEEVRIEEVKTTRGPAAQPTAPEAPIVTRSQDSARPAEPREAQPHPTE